MNTSKFIIASIIKPNFKYLMGVGKKISSQKLGALYQLIYAKEQSLA